MPHVHPQRWGKHNPEANPAESAPLYSQNRHRSGLHCTPSRGLLATSTGQRTVETVDGPSWTKVAPHGGLYTPNKQHSPPGTLDLGNRKAALKMAVKNKLCASPAYKLNLFNLRGGL